MVLLGGEQLVLLLYMVGGYAGGGLCCWLGVYSVIGAWIGLLVGEQWMRLLVGEQWMRLLVGEQWMRLLVGSSG